MNFSHFNTGSIEIDLVVETPGVPDTFVEIKSSERIIDKHLSSLRAVKRDFPKNRYLCLSRDPIARVEDGIDVVPWKDGLKIEIKDVVQIKFN